MTAWVSTSASEWPSRPSSCAIATPPRIERAPRHEPVRVPADARHGGHPIGSRRRSRRSKTASSLTPSSLEQGQRLIVVAAEVLGACARRWTARSGCRRRPPSPGSRAPGRARRRACAAPRWRPRPRCPTRRSPPSRSRSSGAGRRSGHGRSGATPVLDEVGVGEDVEHPARRGLRQPLEVGPPHLVGRARRRPDVVAVVVERPVADEVDRADHVVEVAAGQQLGHAVLAPGDEVGLDPQPEVGLLAHEGAVGVEVVAGRVAPQLVLPHLERLGEAVDVLGHPELLDAALGRAGAVALGVGGRQVALGRRRVDVVGAQVDVVVGEHAAADSRRAGRPSPPAPQRSTAYDSRCARVRASSLAASRSLSSRPSRVNSSSSPSCSSL